jgi:hypothetical protein
LRRTGRPAHRDPFGDDDVTRVRVTVRIVLHAAAGVALAIERVYVALLFVGAMLLAPPLPPTHHAAILPPHG